MRSVSGKYKSKSLTVPSAADGTVILEGNASERIERVLELDKKNKSRYSLLKNNYVMICPHESEIIEIQPGAVYADLQVSSKPKYKSSILIKKDGKWRKRPLSRTMLKRMKKKGTVRL